MTDKSAREIAARGHCRATCGYAKISGAPCETKCTAPDFNLLHGGHYGAVGAILAALEDGGFAVVPVKPTRTMLNAAIDVDSYRLGDISPLGFRCSPQQLFEECWSAMLAASNPKEEGR